MEVDAREIDERAGLGMGIRHGGTNPLLPGRLVPNTPAEINQCSPYIRWQEMMNAESWADIHIDPIKAKFEGTAIMKG
jgi:hypothetical protein